MDGKGNRFSFTYDAVGNRTQTIDPLNRRVTSAYDVANQRYRRTDARGNRTTYIYNRDSVVRSIRYPAAPPTTFLFDAAGNRTMMSNATGRYTTSDDALERPRRVTSPAAKIVSYAYDQVSSRSRLIDPDGGRVTYSYNANNQITQLVNPQGQPTTFSYDNASRRTLKKLSNGSRASFSYDNANQLTTLANMKSDGSMISKYDYQYNAAGIRTRVVEADGSRVTWSYDNSYQLTGEHRTGTTPYRNTFTFDTAGNRLLKNESGTRTTYAYDAANQLRYSQTTGGRTTYTYDADGNQQVVREPSGARTTSTWDYDNRLSSERQPAGTRSTMAYDPDGRRVLLQEPSETRKFIWDVENYLAETDASNATQVVYTNEPRTYGRLISQYRNTSGVWTPSWFHFDAIGSTRQLTSSSAIITDTRLFDAWGVELTASGSTAFPFGDIGVDGYYTDTSSQRLQVRARYLKPTIAAWLSVDPLLFYIAQMNRTYSGGTPLSRIDPSGMQDCACECAGGKWFFAGGKTGGAVLLGYQYLRLNWMCAKRQHIGTLYWKCNNGIDFTQEAYRTCVASGATSSGSIGASLGGGWKGVAGVTAGASCPDDLGGWGWGGFSCGITVIAVGANAGWSPGTSQGEWGVEPGLGVSIIETGVTHTSIWSGGWQYSWERVGASYNKLISSGNCTSTLVSQKPPTDEDNPDRPGI